jgi:choline dehydrogenase
LSFPKYAQPLSSYAVEAYSKAGFNASDGFLNGNLLGYGYWPFTLRAEDSTRSSTETAFLSRTAATTSLKIFQSCMARNLLFDNNKRATGVNVTVDGKKPFTVNARKEVIVSSGFIHSPQLLMVSGIGPRKTLDDLNINVISDLPGVGQNLHDTPNLGGVIYSSKVPSRNAWSRTPESFNAEVERYLTNGSGPLSSAASDFAGWEKFPKPYTTNMSQLTRDFLARLPSDWPNVEYVSDASGRTLSVDGSSRNMGGVGILLVSTTSRGNVTITSADNSVPPKIYLGWLDSQEDQELAVAAYRRARSIAAGNAALGEELSPGANVTTDAQLLDFIKKEGRHCDPSWCCDVRYGSQCK